MSLILFSHLSSQVTSCLKATDVEAKGNESLRPWHRPTACKGQSALPGTEVMSPNALGWEKSSSVFSLSFLLPSHRALVLCAVKSLLRAGVGPAGLSWSGDEEEGEPCLVWAGLSPPPTEGSSCTWKPPNPSTNETPWDPEIAPLTAAQHPFIAQLLCKLGLLLRWHFGGQHPGTAGSMSFENRNVHKGPIMALSLVFRTCPSPERR